jgi:predicted DNA-binding antitoxin AbrB/MazE fold protein
VTLKVQKSEVKSFDSGIARINSSHMEAFDEDHLKMVELRAGKKHKVVKLVSDRFAKKGHVVLREGDMEDLKINDGDEVQLYPYHKISEDLKNTWKKFQDRFRQHKEEDEKEEVK